MTAASTPRCRLTYVIRGTREQVVLQGPRVVIGRSSRCDLTIADDSISRNHAELILGPDGWTLRDLDSRNGTFLNGQRIRNTQPLKAGDRVKVGVATFTVMPEPGEAMPAVSAPVASAPAPARPAAPRAPATAVPAPSKPRPKLGGPHPAAVFFYRIILLAVIVVVAYLSKGVFRTILHGIN